ERVNAAARGFAARAVNWPAVQLAYQHPQLAKVIVGAVTAAAAAAGLFAAIPHGNPTVSIAGVASPTGTSAPTYRASPPVADSSPTLAQPRSPGPGPGTDPTDGAPGDPSPTANEPVDPRPPSSSPGIPVGPLPTSGTPETVATRWGFAYLR